MRTVVRVELHAVNSEALYERLHAEMANVGFSRTINSGDGKRYALPTGTYRSDTYYDESAARDAAARAAESVAPSFGVIATAGKSAWQGLGRI
jgi:hypothetical protein